ncbi:MAG: T9SS type A sorting domain-containing protein [Rhodothermales bacterium]
MKTKLLVLLLMAAVAMPVSASPSDGDDTRLENATDKPDGYVLSSAYPNPFNPSTSFSLTVKERQEVTVEVFNLLGNRVKRLFEGTMESGETRTFTFNADDLPSGIYLYRARGEKFTAARQVTFMK